MTQNVAAVDSHGGCLGTEVYEHTASAALSVGEHVVGKHHGREVHLCYMNVGVLKTFLEVAVKLCAPQDVEEVALQTVTLYANRVYLILRIYLIFLYRRIQDLLLGVGHSAVRVEHAVYHILGYDRALRHLPDDGVLDAAQALAAYAHIHLRDLCLEHVLELLHQVGKCYCGLLKVVDHAFAYA